MISCSARFEELTHNLEKTDLKAHDISQKTRWRSLDQHGMGRKDKKQCYIKEKIRFSQK